MLLRSALLCTVSCLSVILLSRAAQAQEPIKITTDIKGQLLWQGDRDLKQNDEDQQDTQSIDGRVRLSWQATPSLDLFSELRGLKTWGSATVETDEGTDEAANSFLEARQFWVRYQPFITVPGDLQIGRQRINEPSGLWWNRDLDSVRFNYKATLLNGFVGVGENLASYRTGPDDDFREDDEDRLRFFGELSYAWHVDHFLEARVLHENDHSGQRAVGNLIATEAEDDSDARLTWFGVRTHGAQGGWTYRADLMAVRGTDKVEDTSAAGSLRQIDALEKRDVMGWGFDAQVFYTLQGTFKPTLVFGYAFGSGDDEAGDGEDNAFRQSDLHNNSSRLGDTRRALRNYGEVFRPELTNLHILTLGATYPASENSDLALIYHAYRRADEDTGIGEDGLTVNPGTSSGHDIGQEVDMVYNLDLPAFASYDSGIEHSMRFSLGAFRAGDAFTAGDDKTAWRGLVEWRTQF